MTGDTASVHEASALDNVTDIPSGGDSPRKGCVYIAFHRFAATRCRLG